MAEIVCYMYTLYVYFPPNLTHVITLVKRECSNFLPNTGFITVRLLSVEFYLYPTVGTVLIHSVKPELTE